jgi:hypothetical protein
MEWNLKKDSILYSLAIALKGKVQFIAEEIVNQNKSIIIMIMSGKIKKEKRKEK